MRCHTIQARGLPLFVGGEGCQTPNYVKMYFKLPNHLWVVQKLSWGGGIVMVHPVLVVPSCGTFGCFIHTTTKQKKFQISAVCGALCV